MSLGDETVRALERGSYGIEENEDGEATIRVFECPSCGDMFVGHQAHDNSLVGGEPSACCGARLRMGELPLGYPFASRKLCEFLRDVAPGGDPEAPTSNACVVEPLGGIAKYVDVALTNVSGIPPDDLLPPEEEASLSAKMSPVDPIILFPVGTQVYVSSGGALRHMRVTGYVVKPQRAMAWDVVSPRCSKCEQPTEYDARVFVEFDTPPTPWVVKQVEPPPPPWAHNDKPRKIFDVIDAHGHLITSFTDRAKAERLQEADRAVNMGSSNDDDRTLVLNYSNPRIVGECCYEQERNIS